MKSYPFDPERANEIPELDPPADVPSKDAVLEKTDLDIQKSKIELRTLEEEVRRLQNDNSRREEIPSRLWTLTLAWLVAVLSITISAGRVDSFGPALLRLHYESGVLIALISSTTASVIGMYAILLKYLFPEKVDR